MDQTHHLFLINGIQSHSQQNLLLQPVSNWWDTHPNIVFAFKKYAHAQKIKVLRTREA